jgi:hypothetical protein
LEHGAAGARDGRRADTMALYVYDAAPAELGLRAVQAQAAGQ